MSIERHGVSIPLSAAPADLRRLWEACAAQLAVTRDAAAKRGLSEHMDKLADEIVVAAGPAVLLAAAPRKTAGDDAITDNRPAFVSATAPRRSIGGGAR